MVLKEKLFYVLIIVALAAGAVGGFYYGKSRGFEKGNAQGRVDLLAEQKKAQEEELAKAQEELKKAANPFAEQETINPFKEKKGEYKNPFEGANVNPFAR